MKRLLVFALAFVASLAAGSALASDVDVLLSGTHATLTDQTLKDIHSADDLKAFWSDAFGKMSSPPKMPEVDFTKRMVFAVFIGEQEHAGHKVRVKSFDDSGEDFHVIVEVQVPCHVRPEKEDPFVIVSLPTTTKAVTSEIKQHNEMC